MKDIIIDADFLNMLLNRDERDNPKAIFKQLMEELEYRPFLVEYVAKCELYDNKCAQELINEGYITVLHYDEILTDSEKISFESLVWDFADEQAKEDFERPYKSIFSEGFRFAGHNLGEIISEMIALRTNMIYFASNDKGAKALAKRHFNRVDYTLEVKNLAEVLSELNPSDSSFLWKDIKLMLKDARWKNEKDMLRDKWINKM